MRAYAALVPLLLLLSGCLPSENDKPLPKAIVVMEAVDGSSVRGRVTFGEQDGAVRVFIDLTGLLSEHGFHIHNENNCRAALANLRDGHFNPTDKPHGQHLGDLPNLRADVYGTMHEAVLDRNIALSGKDSIIGHAVIITSRYDDYKTQPDGNSGSAIACGVIQGL